MRAALIVVNYGSCALVEANLAPLATRGPELEIIVVDCWTDEAQRDAVRAAGHRHGWTTLLLSENVGFGGGVNRGAAEAVRRGADVLVLLNPDAVMTEEASRSLAEEALRSPDTIIAPIIRRPDGSLWTEGTDLYLDDGTMAGVRHRAEHGGCDRMMWVSGACMALTTALWRSIGGFDERYFLYWEDVDLCRRVLDAGGSCRVVPSVTIVHDQGGTHRDPGRGDAKSETYYYYNIRNRMLFARTHLDASRLRMWRRSSLRVSFGILLRGGRRQLVTDIAPWRALVRALWDARHGVVGCREMSHQTVHRRRRRLQSRRARLYHTVRSAHLERAHVYAPAAVVYVHRRYDFDPSLAEGLELRQTRPLAAALLLRRSQLDTLEVNEPLMLHSAPGAALAIFAVRWRRKRRARVRVVAYAIENTDAFRGMASGLKSGLRSAIMRWASRYVWRQLDAIAFGTAGARDVYGTVLSARPGLQQALIPALPAARSDVAAADRGPSVIFVGAFVARKGFPLLVEAWRSVHTARPDATLTLIGKGPLLSMAQELAASDESVSLHVDPPREVIRSELTRARMLVLPSQRTPTWREQVGLPIVEGLESGCCVITTDQTGLASWLREHGHRVLSATCTPQELADAIIAEADRPNRVAAVLASLPEQDGRAVADRWMFREPAPAAAG